MAFEAYNHDFFGVPNSKGETEVLQEFDGAGRHRITIGEHVSEPAGYCFIATLETPEGVFASTSEYFQGSLPRVFQIIPGV